MYSGYNKRLGIPPLSFTDGPRGIVIGHATCFPAAMTRGCQFGILCWNNVSALLLALKHALAVPIILLAYASTCYDTPPGGALRKTYGEDSFHLGAMGVALMHGVQSQHVMVCAQNTLQ
jgi:beta-glucosidase